MSIYKKRGRLISLNKLLRGRYLEVRQVFTHNEKYKKRLIKASFCGDGRSRTAVQTTHQIAFYTLSLPLVFVPDLPDGRPVKTYPLCLGEV